MLEGPAQLLCRATTLGLCVSDVPVAGAAPPSPGTLGPLLPALLSSCPCSLSFSLRDADLTRSGRCLPLIPLTPLLRTAAAGELSWDGVLREFPCLWRLLETVVDPRSGQASLAVRGTTFPESRACQTSDLALHGFGGRGSPMGQCQSLWCHVRRELPC